MDEAQITYFLTQLGYSKIKSNPKWVYTSCPFASWKHPKGTDSHPSFGISIVPGGKSGYSCFACQSHGDIIGLLFKLQRFTGKDYSQLATFVQNANAPSTESLLDQLNKTSYAPTNSERREVGGIRVSDALFKRAPLAPLGPVILPESDLDAFLKPSGRALEYLTGSKRRLTTETIEDWDLRWHPKARRIGIPIRDVQGRLVGISGRAIFDDIKPKFLHSAGFQRNLYLFGEHKVEKGKRGYIVEGHFDAIYLSQAGYPNAVAIMGGSISPLQVEKAVQLFSDVVIVPDGDAPGKAIADQVYSSLKSRLPVRIAEVPDGSDPDELSRDTLESELGPPRFKIS